LLGSNKNGHAKYTFFNKVMKTTTGKQKLHYMYSKQHINSIMKREKKRMP
jgi:hypothetical protein